VRPPQLAALGFALAGLGYALWLPNMFAFDLLSPPLTAVQALALAGAGSMLAARRPGAAAASLLVGTGANVADFVRGIGGDITTVNSAFSTLGWLLLAWYGVLWSLEPARASRLFGMRVGALTMAFGHALWLPYNVVTSTYQWMPGNLVGIAGLLLVARHLGALPPPAARAAEPAPA
jgi:hypothetical protein